MADGEGSGSGGGDQGGQGGGAADLLFGGSGGGAGGDQGGAGGDQNQQGGDQGGAGGDQGQQGGAADQAFLGQFSTDPLDGDGPSLQDWVNSTGVKDVNGLAKIARDNQRALRESGRVKVPGEGASEAEVKAWRAAIGVPETAEGYAIAAPKDAAGNDVPMDTAALDRLAAKALDAGVPEAAYKAIVGEYVAMQLEGMAARESELNAEGQAWLKEQGDKAPAQSAAINRAAQALGLERGEIAAVRGALGSRRMAEIFAKLGNGIGEDALVTGGSGGGFMPSGDEAQAEINRMRSDPATVQKMAVKGTPENLKYERLVRVAGEAANRKAAAGLA